jgi:hypothetical protein
MPAWCLLVVCRRSVLMILVLARNANELLQGELLHVLMPWCCCR